MTDADTLRMLEDAANGLARFDAARVRALRGQTPGFDRATWSKMAEQGWFGILVPEEDGGLGLHLDAVTTVAQAIGAAAMPEPFVAAGVLTPRLLSLCPSSEARETHLGAVISGDEIACVAFQDVAGTLAPETTGVRAQPASGGMTLDGEARFVAVPDADAFIVVANAGASAQSANLGLYWVPANAPGLTITREQTADGGALGWLTLNSVEVPAAQQLATGDTVSTILADAFDNATVANAAELQGITERCLALTLEYFKTRAQFGQQIGKFQVLQHRAVNLWMNKEVARHALNAGLATMMAPNVPAAARAQAASSIKARVARTALDVGNDAIQLHGAIGFTDEYDLALYVNRSLAIAPFLGNANDHLRRYGLLKQRRSEAAA